MGVSKKYGENSKWIPFIIMEKTLFFHGMNLGGSIIFGNIHIWYIYQFIDPM